jgi:hypothetical protein
MNLARGCRECRTRAVVTNEEPLAEGADAVSVGLYSGDGNHGRGAMRALVPRLARPAKPFACPSGKPSGSGIGYLGLTVGALLLGLGGPLGAATVTINGGQTYQTIEGFGVNANHRNWTNNELQPVLDALIDQAGMTLFRVLYDRTDWETGNDNADPAVMNWAYYNALYSSADFEAMWGMVGYLNQRGISEGITLNFQGRGPPWMSGAALNSGYEAEWAEMVASLLIYARNTRQLKFTLAAPANEPDNTADPDRKSTRLNSSHH